MFMYNKNVWLTGNNETCDHIKLYTVYVNFIQVIDIIGLV